MDFLSIKKNLSHIIDETLSPLICGDYVLWGLPNYRNEGDVMIWQGTLDYLKTIPHRCIETVFYDEYQYHPLPKDTVILIMGGGYFGDVWRRAWEYVVNTISKYPENHIIILPQSIYYLSEEILVSDRQKLEKCKHLTICARDMDSYEFAKKQFDCHRVLLVPDMAFHIKSIKKRKKPGKGIIYIKRNDKESVPINDQSLYNKADVIADWPSINGYMPLSFCFFVYSKLRRFWNRPFFHRLSCFWMDRVFRPVMLRHAVRFIMPFHDIYTTRLHAVILSLILGKKVHYIDNSYGKLSALHRTWLHECDTIDRFY